MKAEIVPNANIIESSRLTMRFQVKNKMRESESIEISYPDNSQIKNKISFKVYA